MTSIQFPLFSRLMQTTNKTFLFLKEECCSSEEFGWSITGNNLTKASQFLLLSKSALESNSGTPEQLRLRLQLYKHVQLPMRLHHPYLFRPIFSQSTTVSLPLKSAVQLHSKIQKSKFVLRAQIYISNSTTSNRNRRINSILIHNFSSLTMSLIFFSFRTSTLICCKCLYRGVSVSSTSVVSITASVGEIAVCRVSSVCLPSCKMAHFSKQLRHLKVREK